jgi:hypothetical protein
MTYIWDLFTWVIHRPFTSSAVIAFACAAFSSKPPFTAIWRGALIGATVSILCGVLHSVHLGLMFSVPIAHICLITAEWVFWASIQSIIPGAVVGALAAGWLFHRDDTAEVRLVCIGL